MQLGHPEALGVQHHHDRRLRDVHPHLDHGGGDQDPHPPGGEVAHHGVLLVGGQPAVQHAQRRPRQRAGGQLAGDVEHRQRRCGGPALGPAGGPVPVHTPVGIPRRGDQVPFRGHQVPVRGHQVPLLLRPAGGVPPDPRAHDVGPAPRGHLLPDALPGPVEVVRPLRHGHHVAGDPGPPTGQLPQRAHLQVTEDGHRHRAGDRGRGHDQQVRGGARLGPQRVALLDAEPVLLVDDDQAQVGELDRVLQQGVGADHEARDPLGDVGQGGPPGRRTLGPGEQGHPGGLLGTAQLPGGGQRTEQRRQRPVVLLGEHLGGGQQGGLPARVDHRQHGPQRHHRLARAHLTLEQPLHRVVGGQVGEQGRAHLLLAAGQGERQAGVERLEQPAGPGHPGHRRLGPRRRPPAGQHQLQQEGLLEPQPGQPPVHVPTVLRAVHQSERGRQVHQAVPLAQVGGQRVGDLVEDVEHHPHRPRDAPGGQRRGGRVDRDQRAGEVVGGRRVARLGVLRRPPGAEQHVVGMRQLAAAPVDADLPGEQPAAPGHEVAGPPRLVEERQRQGGVPVPDPNLQQLATPGPHRSHGDVHHLGQHRHVFLRRQLGQLGELPALGVAPRVVAQQVPGGVQVQAGGEGGRGAPPDHSGERRF